MRTRTVSRASALLVIGLVLVGCGKVPPVRTPGHNCNPRQGSTAVDQAGHDLVCKQLPGRPQPVWVRAD